MKILLFGMNGQLGWELQRSLCTLGKVLALDVDSADPTFADFARPDTLIGTLRVVEPQIIVNAAAYTAVDQAETEPSLVHTINAVAPAVLAREAAAIGAWLVHYSTDYVFDGSGHSPWQEDAVTAPLNVYGRTKLEGELAIRASGCKHLILRSSWIYSARGLNFARTMLRLAATRERLEVVDDQVGAPTGAELLADITAHTVRSVRATPELGGSYHVAASGETSRHGFARHVIEFARASGQVLQVPADGVVGVPSSTIATAARRPLNSRLACSKLQHCFGLHLPDWRCGVERMLREVLV